MPFYFLALLKSFAMIIKHQLFSLKEIQKLDQNANNATQRF